ncbi:uncharacterized protein [Palaemon carinicauda]|uniref:uncharacterized protein isoform X2 n=1 Tax=Palaemon carinicauda TaxID=392227 RepID=UPI0035B5EB32
MGNVDGKAVVEVAQMAIRTLPPLIMAFQSTKSSEKNSEDEKIAQVLELLQEDRRALNQVLQNQARLEDSYQALVTLMNRVEESGPERQQRRGADGQGSRIQIVMDLPDDIEDRNRALDNFWRTLGRVATDYEQERGHRLAVDPQETESEGQSPEVNPLLCCEVCTQAYNNDERRPTLLPDCGHTFCKDCLSKARRRNRACPTCRKYCNSDVENLPTNYSILDFMNEDANKKSKTHCGRFDDDDYNDDDDDDECKKNRNANSDNCNRRGNYSDFECDMPYEEQLQLASLISLEDQQKRQADEDFRIAQRLQEEEERVMRFSQHEDYSRKRQMYEGDDLERGRSRTIARRQTRLHESSRRNSNRCSGGCYDEEEEATRGARRKSCRSNHSYDDEDDDEVSCHRLSSGKGIYDEARQNLPEPVHNGDSGHEKSYSDVVSQDRLEEGDGFEDDDERNSSREMPYEESLRGDKNEETPKKGKEEFSDDDDDGSCHRSRRGPYASAREKLDDCYMEGDDDDSCCKDTGTRKEDDSCEEDGFAREKNAMVVRAISTHEEDKEKRRLRKYLREQEELEFALALSLSIMPQQQEGQVG